MQGTTPAFSGSSLRALVQVLIVGAVIYVILARVARPRAVRLLTALLVVMVTYVIVWVLQLTLIQYALESVLTYGAIATLIIYQPELRSSVARLGRSRLVHEMDDLEESELLDEIVDAVERLARAKVGAIMVVERNASLEEFAETGTRLDARVGADLLLSIFSPYSPLHDGAVLIAGDSIFAAGVILPLTQFPVADRALGTRHRAAIGVSEETDATAIVVSEETSQVSIAQAGRIERDVDMPQLRRALAAILTARTGERR